MRETHATPQTVALAGEVRRRSIPQRLFESLWTVLRSISFHRPVSSLRLQESLSLGERKSIIVVHWEQRRYLLGVTPQTFQLLDSCSAPAAKPSTTSFESSRAE